VAKHVPAIGYFREAGIDVCGGIYAMHGRRICCSSATMPMFWRRMLVANQLPRPGRTGLSRRAIATPTAILGSWDYNNYGHFWLDVAPRLFSLQRFRPDLLATLSIAVPGDLASWARDALCTIYGLSAGSFVDCDVATEYLRCDDAIIPALIHTNYDLHPLALEFYRYVVEVCAAGTKGESPDRLIYVTRRRFSQRAGRPVRTIANAAESEALAASMGFDIVAPEELNWRDQVTSFSQARVVVGEHGSAMKNLLFAPRGAVAVAIDILNPTQGQIAALKGQGYIVIKSDGFAAGDPLRPHVINLARLRMAIRKAIELACPLRRS